jgi:hypothetical protein
VEVIGSALQIVCGLDFQATLSLQRIATPDGHVHQQNFLQDRSGLNDCGSDSAKAADRFKGHPWATHKSSHIFAGDCDLLSASCSAKKVLILNQ